LDPATFTSLPPCCLNEMLLGLCMGMAMLSMPTSSH
jgi:hypothetical protein